jgi:type II secretory pathway pseudopilin PulG
MNLSQSSAASQPGKPRSAAFTLPEAVVATALFSLLVLGIVSANLFGLRWYELGQNKLRATDSAREAIGKMSDELRNCSSAIVGNISNGVFLAHVAGEVQTGNGLVIYATTNTNNYVLYFLNATNNTFVRFATDLNTNIVIAQNVTNTNVFQLQDCLGNTLTNNQNNHVVHCALDFYTIHNQSATGDAFQLQTSVAPRAQN